MRLSIKRKHWVLTLLLGLGFSIQGCEDPIDCNCGKSEGNYFNIQGLSAGNYRQLGSSGSERMSAGQTALLADYFLNVNYQVTYYSAHSAAPQRRAAFSLISQAYACSCRNSGDDGSQERLKSLTVITLNNFDTQHPANAPINDLLTVATASGTFDLTTFLKTDTTRIKRTGYTLKLKQKPAADFAAKVILELQNGEIYSATTESVKIQ